jgi:hypothetical protein
MSEVLECKRELIVDKPADQVWEWLSNLRHAMTANQFHLSIDCDDAVARSPKAGLEVPILHEIMGHRAYRIARVTRFEDYAISWGERIPDDATYEDSFPHSEGWRIESLGSNRCRIQNHLRGRWMLPVGQLIGRHSWDIIIPPILDNDLQDVAFAAGAIDQKIPVEMPQVSGALLRLMHTLEIDGKSAKDVLKVPPLAPKHAGGH